MKKVAEKYFKDPKKYIPHGVYCYTINNIENGLSEKDPPIIRTKLCPFWQFDKTKPTQENGYCAYLGLGDWMPNGTFMLWDQCKECEINWDDEDDLGDLNDIDT
jgi:hypothetical protein